MVFLIVFHPLNLLENDIKQAIKGFLSIYYKKWTTQEKVVCCFSFGVTVICKGQSIFRILTKFMFIEVTKL